MKKIILLILISFSGFSQIDTTQKLILRYFNTICLQRDHVFGSFTSITCLYCPPIIKDTDSTTIIIYPACNYITKYCTRCGARVVEQEKERREILWPKQKLPDSFKLIRN